MRVLVSFAIGLLIAACSVVSESADLRDSSVSNAPPTETSSDRSIETTPAAARIDSTSLPNLPDGDYLLVSRDLIDAGVPDNYRRIHLRKQGNLAVGIHLIHLDDNPCVSGEIRSRSLINVSIAQPIAMGEEWRYSTAESIDLTGYQLTSEPADNGAIESCISQF